MTKSNTSSPSPAASKTQSNLFSNQAQALSQSPEFKAAKEALLRVIEKNTATLRQVRPGPSTPAIQQAYADALKEFSQDRGRDLYYPFIGSGLGHGPFVELLDGSVKYDMITGIGINFFGHTHSGLMGEMIEGLSQDVMQGNLQPGQEIPALIRSILAKVGGGCRLNHGWLMCSGTMSNEVALKIIRQKKAPATRILAFEDCFAGRSTAMQEITDNPAYRQGQPVYGEVSYLKFYSPELSLEKNIERTTQAIRAETARYPGKYAALMLEIVQGEGGFNSAPREWYVRVFEEAKKAGLAIWADEVQTFGRTGELFAFQKFCLGEYVDVVTVGKLLQACMVLFTDEFNPKPGLVAGTFAGSTVAIRTARKTLELLDQGGHLGPEGHIEKMSRRFVENFEKMKSGSLSGIWGGHRAVGGMIAFQPFQGTQEQVKSVLMKLFDRGVIAFSCGHGPYLVRMLPPLPVMSSTDVDAVCGLIEQTLLEIKNAAV